MQRHDGTVRGCGGIEGKLRSRKGTLFSVGCHEGVQGYGDIGAITFGPGKAGFDGRKDDSLKIARAVKGMDHKALTQLTCKTRQAFVHPGNVDRDGGVLNRARIEERRHERQLVVRPAEVQLGAVLPTIPECTGSQNLLTELAW